MTITSGTQILAADVYPLVISGEPGGRLTLESGVPVSSADQSAKATLYYTPYKGNLISLYDGTKWNALQFVEISLDISGFTADKNYDVWAYDNSGTVTLDSTVWTNDSTRATALAYQDGVLVKAAATTRRYLGTIRIKGTGGQCEDTKIFRGVWNMYNRVRRILEAGAGGTHNYNGASRLWNNSTTNNLIKWVIGLASVMRVYNSSTNASGSDGTYAITHVVVDGSADNRAQVQNYNPQWIQAGNSGDALMAAGYHYASMYEWSNSALSAFTAMRLAVDFEG